MNEWTNEFTKPLTVTFFPKENKWRVDRSFEYHQKKESRAACILVEKGWLTDFASVPWAAQWLIPKSGKYNQAAVLHDYIYSKGGKVRSAHTNKVYFYTKKEADVMFLDAMKLLGVPLWKRRVMYRAVRIAIWNEKKFIKKD